MKLYHYCSNQSFLSILRTKELWATDLGLSNDRLEGRWLREIFIAACEAKKVAEYDKKELFWHLDYLINFTGAGGFCLSEEGDLLSQWRGYADNGAGVSIGFEKDTLDAPLDQKPEDDSFGVALRQIIYDGETQEKKISPFLQQMMKEIENGATKSMVGSILMPTSEEEKTKIQEASRRLSFTFLSMFPLLYTLKNPAFSEEREWRLISYMTKSPDKYHDHQLPSLDFMAKQDRIVPVRHIPWSRYKAPLITKIVLGPRNITPKPVIAAVMEKYGLADAEISISNASYR